MNGDPLLLEYGATLGMIDVALITPADAPLLHIRGYDLSCAC